MKKATKRDLKKINVQTNKKGGFTVWITEKKEINGELKNIEHWILDGSLIKEDAEIRLGNNNIWKINAEFNKAENTIYVTKS